jgi:hypothetical protein
MLSRGISEEEIHEAIEIGELEFIKKDEIGRGTEYTHSFESKESYPRKIMVGWTYDKKDILIMTVYEVKRKSRQI